MRSLVLGRSTRPRLIRTLVLGQSTQPRLIRTLVLGRSTRPRLMRTLVLGRSTRPRLIRTLVLGRSTRPGSSMRSLLDQGASRRAQSRSGRANSRSFFSFLINFGQVRRGALAHTCLDLVVYLVPSIIPLSNLHWGRVAN